MGCLLSPLCGWVVATSADWSVRSWPCFPGASCSGAEARFIVGCSTRPLKGRSSTVMRGLWDFFGRVSFAAVLSLLRGLFDLSSDHPRLTLWAAFFLGWVVATSADWSVRSWPCFPGASCTGAEARFIVGCSTRPLKGRSFTVMRGAWISSAVFLSQPFFRSSGACSTFLRITHDLRCGLHSFSAGSSPHQRTGVSAPGHVFRVHHAPGLKPGSLSGVLRGP